MKKLLGILAVAPLALTACNNNDKGLVLPENTGEVETVKNDVRFVAAIGTEQPAQLIITGIELESATDADGFNAIGLAIQTAYAANTMIDGVTDMVLEGTFDGVDFYKQFKIDGVEKEDGTTPFNDLGEVLNHTFTAETTFTNEGLAARALKDAGTHVTPDSVSRDDYKAMMISLQEIVDIKTTMTYTELSAEQTANQGDPLLAYSKTEAADKLGITAASYDEALDNFDESYFVFEHFKFDINESSSEVTMTLHHESNPANQWFSTWTLDVVTA